MKLIQSLDLSEGISMDSLKPIINSGSEASFDSCLGMKDSVMDEHLLHSEKLSQISQQKDTSLTDIDVEYIGNNTKKMFEKVDLKSSDLSIKRDPWDSEADYDKSSEKENMGETNEVRFDFISDDESESIHLKMSSDDDNSVGEAENEKTCGSDEVEKSNASENINSTENVETDSDKAKTCSINDVNSTKTSTKVDDENSVEESMNNASFLSCLDDTTCHDTFDVSSADGLECTPSCSKEINHVSGVKSTKQQNEVINEMSDDEQEVDITSDEKSCFNVSKNEYGNVLLIPAVEDSMPLKIPDDSEELSVIEDDNNLSKRINNKNAHFTNSEIDSCALRTERQSASDNNTNTWEKGINDSKLGKDIAGIVINDTEPHTNLSSADGVCNGKEENSDLIISSNLSDLATDEEKEVIQSHNDESKAMFSETQVDQTLQICPKISESNSELLDESRGDHSQEVKIDCNVEMKPIKSHILSNSESPEEFMDCSNSKDGNPSEKVSVTDNSSDNRDSGFPSNEDLTEFRGALDSTEDNKCKPLSGTLYGKAALLHSSKTEDMPQPPRKKKSVRNKQRQDRERHRRTREMKKPPQKGNQNRESTQQEVKEGENHQYGVTSEGKVKDGEKKKPPKKENRDSDTSEKEVKKGEKISHNKEMFFPFSTVVPSSRKRTSQSGEEKAGVSSKRSKVATSDSDDSDLKLFDNKSSEQLNKTICNSTKDDEIKELSTSTGKVNSEHVSDKLSTGDTVEKLSVRESVDRKVVLVDSESNAESKKELESEQKVKVNPLPFLRNFNRAQLQTMTRNDLEELVLQKICEAIAERSVCGELREIAVSLDQKLKAWQKKSFQLSKQVKDLSVVVKRYGSDLQSKGPNAAPMKITRSVGLQVQMPGSSTVNWNQDDQSWRKGEKVQSTPTSVITTKATANSLMKTTPSSPSAKLPPNSPVSQKTVENTNIKVNSQSPVVQNTQSASTGLKVMQTKSPTSATPPSSSSKTSQKPSVSAVNNRLKVASDLQVIDLTDAEDKLKSGNSVPTTNTPSTDTSSTVVTSVNTSPVANVGCRSIRVVQHLGSTSASPLLTQTVTTAVAGQRVAYYVPTTTVPQRQLIISNQPVRPPGVVVSHRPSSIPAIVLKQSPMVPVSTVPASNTNIIRASNVNNALQVVPARPQPRTAHYLQRNISVSSSPLQSAVVPSSPQHPAPLPPVPTSGPNNANWKLPPPKPDLKISKVPNRNQQGIVLSWNMTVSSEYEEIASYQLFAYQEGSAAPSTKLWKKVGDVKALPLPMACTLTQFMEGHKYHFAVRAVDVYARYGPFSSPGNIVLTRN